MSGSIASWVRIGITLISQIIMVPLFLNSWEIKTYGAWLLLHSTWAIINIMDLSYHDYIGYECLKQGQYRSAQINEIISSSLAFSILVALIDIVVILILNWSPLIADLVTDDPIILWQWKISLLLLGCNWAITGAWGGILSRWITPFGHYHQLAWWNTFNILLITTLPVLAVFYGANLMGATIAWCLGSLFAHIVLLIFLRSVIRAKPYLRLHKPNIKKGLDRLLLSLVFSVKYYSDIFRQQGVRIFLAPIVGLVQMTSFSTMRTAANVSMQGLSTIINPIMPELMNYIIKKDQNRIEGLFSSVWLGLIFILNPGILLLQYYFPLIFQLWTANKISMNPMLFGFFSASILVFTLSQPAFAVVKGINNVAMQIIIALALAAIVIIGSILLIPNLGILGVGISLLIAEIFSLFCFVTLASVYLKEINLRWPAKQFIIALALVTINMLSLFCIVTKSYGILAVSNIIYLIVLTYFIIHIPKILINKIKRILNTSIFK
ncbi:hypothetical protein ICN32_11470 [Polynucleobacter wuianus]|uniref:lipopolysaccharide biosynthesis protein n=1 Tax=Polynucleobacter wuianus TaxID=1743168 RepID=UPI001C0D09E2|nr:hypothetical protein [Polynucleobacter wuianus]MBU3611172.1 hypothetical protein [Polynucleobacter wuianus]